MGRFLWGVFLRSVIGEKWVESGGGSRFCVAGKEEIGFYWDRGDALIFLFKSDMNSNADDADFALPAAKFF